MASLFVLSLNVVEAAPKTSRLQQETMLLDSKNNQPLTANRVVAVVNGQIITLIDFNNRVRLVRKNLSNSKQSLPSDDLIQQEVMRQLVQEKVQLQYAQASGESLTEEELDKLMLTVAEQNKMDLAALQASIQKEGMSYAELREEVRTKATIERLRGSILNSRVTVSDAEANQAVQILSDSAEYRLSNIFIPIAPDASEKNKTTQQALAQKILINLEQGLPFADQAKKYSAANNAAQGGQLGWRSPNNMPPKLVELIERLKPGENSQVITAPEGLYIFQLLEKRRMISGENQLDQVKQQISQKKSEQQYQEWLQQLLDNAVIDSRIQEK
ncbi:MAG: peptidylprolyl isomerase [Neisseriaceae bacterium]|nr:peptidylprolyl isomerase [Neisseriaceae bacterium]